jgi:UDP-N-acetyl-2-amino-2-deoxyglucuronate dehydrogenase
MERVRFGIIGVGKIAPIHAQAIIDSPRGELVAVAGRRQEAVMPIAERYGVKGYTDYHEMLARDDIDAVIIGTPSGSHGQIGIHVAKSGKHVVVEKPMDITLEKADDLIRTCEESGVKLSVVFQLRFMEECRRVKTLIESGALGKVVLGDAYLKFHRSPEYYRCGGWRGTWEVDGGAALMNQGIHGIDLLQWFMGPVKSVYALTKTLVHDIEAEDTAAALLEFESGAIGVIEGTTSIYPDLSQVIQIQGSKGCVTLTGTEVPKVTFLECADGKRECFKEDWSDELGEGHALQVEDVIDSILQNRPPAIDGYEGRKALEIVLAIYESGKTGRPIKLL